MSSKEYLPMLHRATAAISTTNADLVERGIDAREMFKMLIEKQYQDTMAVINMLSN